MTGPRPAPRRAVRRAFLTLLGLGFLAAFVSLWVQVTGLLGSHGLAPAAELLERVGARLGGEAPLRLPTLLWLAHGDAALHALCAAGVLAAGLLTAGVAPRWSLVALWVLYLSLVNVGDVFLGYQWDALLLETGLLATFLAPAGLRPAAAARRPVDPVGLWLLRLLLFKLMFLSGAVKLLSGDPTWRSLTALRFHYFTQPLPTWTSWYAHQLPDALQSISTALTLGVELLLPFGIFLGRRARLVACAGLAALQALILATGSYGFFNLLALALCLLLLDDAAVRRLLPRRWRSAVGATPAATLPHGAWRRARFALKLALAVLLVLLSSLEMLDRLGLAPPRPAGVAALERGLAPFRVASSYGLFAVMTTERDEIEISGSHDGRSWRTYAFRWKPGDLERRPRFAGLHMPRLDWQMWFASLRGCQRAVWFHSLLRRLLEGEPSVLALLADDPFPDGPPRYLRSRLDRYTFAPAGSVAWWQREPLGAFCPTVRLRGDRLVPVPESALVR